MGRASPGINSAHRTHAQGEESLWFGHLMSSGKRMFARCLLPKCCKPEAEDDPKRNILVVAEHDFSPKIVQAAIGKPP